MIDDNVGTPEKSEVAPDKVATPQQIRDQFIGNTGRTQCLRLLAALAGCTLHQLDDGSYLVCKWGLAKELTCLRAVDDMLRQIGGEK